MIASYKVGRGDEEHEPELRIWEQFEALRFVKYGSKTQLSRSFIIWRVSNGLVYFCAQGIHLHSVPLPLPWLKSFTSLKTAFESSNPLFMIGTRLVSC